MVLKYLFIIDNINIMVDNIKNKVFLENTTDPLTGRFVKSIYRMKITKLDKENWQQVWQYYRDRGRSSVESAYQKYKGNNIRVIYFKDPKQYYYYLDPEIKDPKECAKEIEKPIHKPDPNFMRKKEKKKLLAQQAKEKAMRDQNDSKNNKG